MLVTLSDRPVNGTNTDVEPIATLKVPVKLPAVIGTNRTKNCAVRSLKEGRDGYLGNRPKRWYMYVWWRHQ